MTVHSEILEQRRSLLSTKPREELLARRALLEGVVREADAHGFVWRDDVAQDDDPRLTVQEQLDLLSEALATDPSLDQVVGLQTGVAIVHTFRQGETNG